ncbi:hypothetical protein E4T47_02521 [Aureobasidium subglaciale]|nr:hypothetical protein E4T47_02521 [Aureobasidium subglaciale]
MCYHRYTSHICGHKSASIGRCNVDILATAVPFCDRYHLQKTASFELCGGDYCKEDEVTADWAENGASLLIACEDDLLDLKNRLDPLKRNLEVLEDYKKAWGSLAPDVRKRALSMHEDYEALRRTYADKKARRQRILNGISQTKEKQQAAIDRTATMIKQARAIYAAKMRRVQQFVNTQTQQSPSLASPEANSKYKEAFVRGMLKRADPGIWEHGDNSATPCRPAANAIPSAQPSAKRSELLAQEAGGPPSLASAFSFTDRMTIVDPSPSPVKKRRGRPPKVPKIEHITPGLEGTRKSAFYSSEIDYLGGPATNEQDSAPKRRSVRGTNKMELPAQTQPSSGTRRSGRVKQRVSYAESPTSSPEKSAEDEFDFHVDPKITRVPRAVGSKKNPREDEGYTGREDDGEDNMSVDDEWQGEEGVAENDMDVEPTPAQSTRWSKKRTATSPLRNPRLEKRQTMAAFDGFVHNESDEHDGWTSGHGNGQQQVRGTNTSWAYMDPSEAQSLSKTAPQWLKNQTPAASLDSSSYNMAMINRAQESASRGHNGPLTPHSNATNGRMSKILQHRSPAAAGFGLSSTGVGAQYLNNAQISPMCRSDMMNGLGRADLGLSILNVEDHNDYDFDVGVVSRAVADLDAQQN